MERFFDAFAHAFLFLQSMILPYRIIVPLATFLAVVQQTQDTLKFISGNMRKPLFNSQPRRAIFAS